MNKMTALHNINKTIKNNVNNWKQSAPKDFSSYLRQGYLLTTNARKPTVLLSTPADMLTVSFFFLISSLDKIFAISFRFILLQL